MDKLSDFPNSSMVDRTRETAMIAVQGPSAAPVVQSLLPFNPDASPLFSIALPTTDTLIARTGYTGEDGVELIVEADAALSPYGTASRQRASNPVASSPETASASKPPSASTATT